MLERSTPELAAALLITVAGSPDWPAIETEITCPLCDYNLRGLTDPICPECGHRFDWPTVLGPSKRIHPYLFEHHPERNVRSFVRMLLGQWGPWNFWKKIDPAQPPRVGRIVAYGIVCSVVAMLPVLIASGAAIPHLRPPIAWPGIRRFLLHDIVIRGLFVGCGIAAVFPWLNALALQIFGQSLRPVRIKPVHVLRCAISRSTIVVRSLTFAAMRCFGPPMIDPRCGRCSACSAPPTRSTAVRSKSRPGSFSCGKTAGYRSVAGSKNLPPVPRKPSAGPRSTAFSKKRLAAPST